MNAPSPLRPILPARAILPARPILPAQPIRPTRTTRGSGVIQGAFLGGKPRLTMTAGRPGSGAVQRSAAIPTSNATPLPPEFGGFRPVMPAQRMPEAIQRKMETLFKASFSDVRIHVGPDAGLIGASAFTQGSDVFFAPGQYNPNTPGGQRLLGQQLAHVVQQRTGRARNPFGSGIAVVNDPMLKAEAEMMGSRAATAQAVQTKAPGKGLVGPHAGTGSPRQVPGPILPKRAGAGATTAPTGGWPSAKAGPVLPSVPGPILPKRIDTVGTPILPGGSTSFGAAGGPILPSKPVQAKLAPGPILPGRPSSIGGPILPSNAVQAKLAPGPILPGRPSSIGGPILPSKAVQAKLAPGPILPGRSSSIADIANRAVQPMMAIGAAVAFGHQLFNSVVTQVGRRVLGI
jgi:Domain of unknown function (DUF4157)